jgi:hypothetical protein
MAGRTHPERAPIKRQKRIKYDGRKFDTARELMNSRRSGNAVASKKRGNTRKRKREDEEDGEVFDLSVFDENPAEDPVLEIEHNEPPPIEQSSNAVPPSNIGLTVMPGPKWQQNSCWLDCSTSLIFMAIIRDFHTWKEIFDSVPASPDLVLNMLKQTLLSRKLLVDGPPPTLLEHVARLSQSRNVLRHRLFQQKMLAYGEFDHQPVFVSANPSVCHYSR